MTTPAERTRAVLSTEEFLAELLDPRKTPRVPSALRERARRLLRHYPTAFELASAACAEKARGLPIRFFDDETADRWAEERARQREQRMQRQARPLEQRHPG